MYTDILMDMEFFASLKFSNQSNIDEPYLR